ncbi:AMP-dependent synthetase and ligase [Pseudarthrobacter chlorophenolicus A6]|uniref:AMP-dependent synthetase and ligase n=1 Tax=Pseudarthrobacter chlorophenolicus (strain ATCC 700700 / DSM 12829 / CIP 107037 / JCM 12360 / KCTC 9906 / NCIMB 13794 / A6) TaxID=452863 RepID=B8HGF3_PSECP|nr:AMP-binding protein [Pseudarthrobacter chlorophenolicus]ACL39515.1 AMP-dependent synthetase and ligase [Pseudarthrobacter chlorophenolicus A6]SDQ98108.1 propionyl-CoA synthetase [Pseudarthrobacter chlorophenolicus]
MVDSYRETYETSLAHPAAFWLGAAAGVDWSTPPRHALDASRAPLYGWFPDGTLNTCYNALDRHVEAGRGSQDALIYDSAMLGTQRRFTYAELTRLVADFAGVLRDRGVGKGDRIVIYMPMIPEAVIAMLASARLGAVHSVVFGGFAPKELAARIRDAQPVLLVTASGGLEPTRRIEYLPAVAEALALAGVPGLPVIAKAREGFAASAADHGWLDWDTEVAGATPAPPVDVAATDPLYILYTSGTTGTPKGVVRDNGGHAVALDWTLRNIYGAGPGDVMWTASDVGWVVGHSYIVYGPLLAGATSVLYEGKPVGTPDAGAFWRVVRDHRVNVLFTAPTALRAIRKADPEAALLRDYDISSLRTLFTAGERLDTDTFHWASMSLGVPVVDHWWQTETGWAICANPRGLEELPIKAGSPSVPMPGFRLAIVDGLGEEVEPGVEGNIVLKLPLPPGTLTTLWGNDERFVSSYLQAFEGCYATGDSGYRDSDGYVFVMGRTDDIINVAGHRLSTGAMEQVIGQHPAVAECAVIGLADPLKGQRPSGYVVLKSGVDVQDDVLAAELVAMVRRDIGAVADFKHVTVVDALPKTRSGKILRKTMRQIADGVEYTVPSTTEDVGVIEQLIGTLRPEIPESGTLQP